jgi:formamidopyrimidine-DNA glycosylase
VPELPEVETVKRGIAPHLVKRRFQSVIIRDHRLRWPVDPNLADYLIGQEVLSVERRAKYVLVRLVAGYLVIHLGMSGRLYFVSGNTPVAKHDHLDWQLNDGQILRYTDPRRFGAVIWIPGDDVSAHKLFSALGPEPLHDEFDAHYLFKRSSVSLARYIRLVTAVKLVLKKAIMQGGTTLKDFVGGDGKPGYFKQELQVYGRGGDACTNCARILIEIKLAQRTTVFCKTCQR